MLGDLVLYKSDGSIGDWFISNFTDGPFTHVEIDMGNNICIGEHGSGLWRGNCDWGRPHIFVTPLHVVSQAGLQWVMTQYEQELANGSAHPYGWLDIASEALKIMGQRIILRQKGAWDCSDFATRYLIAAGAAAPLGKLATTPELVSPNDLARAFGVKDPALFDKAGRPKK